MKNMYKKKKKQTIKEIKNKSAVRVSSLRPVILAII